MKIVGRRHLNGDAMGALQRTLAHLRGTGALVPRGVYRFASFEEADAWMTRTMARTHASLKSKDLAPICRALNEAQAPAIVLIGGFAVIAHGGVRTTKDIDLLVDAAPDNIARVKRALSILEERLRIERERT